MLGAQNRVCTALRCAAPELSWGFCFILALLAQNVAPGVLDCALGGFPLHFLLGCKDGIWGELHRAATVALLQFVTHKET